ncbi:MAG: hydroxymethylbilane synthase [Thermodesulfobacteriota bacterium]
MSTRIRIGTRGSLLAWTQSSWVKAQIETRFPDLTVELVKIVTKGDKIQDVPLAMVGGKGLFVKEIEDALVRGEVDLAVHSMKDVPTVLPAELHLGVVTQREDPRDVFVASRCQSLAELPAGARVGTSSLRRRAQLVHLRPDLTVENLRGNLDTRLRKLAEGAFDAVVVAAAGLRRLGMIDRATAFFSPVEMLPAIGQGALGLELRRADDWLLSRLGFLNHEETAVAVRAERAFLARLEGGCQVPIGAHGEVAAGQVTLTGLVAAVDGSRLVKRARTAPAAEAEALGWDLAGEILDAGGREILEAVYGRSMEGA